MYRSYWEVGTMIPRALDHVHCGILDHCSKRLVALKPIEGKVAAHTPLYRHAAELRQWGLLSSPKKGLWATTDAGLRALDDARAGIPENPLDALYPPLRLLPMPLRALVRLLMLADGARRHRLREGHHPSGLLLGPTMTLKSTTAQFLAYALGEDPTRAVILTPTESGRSVAVRKSYAGTIASTRAALGWRYVAFDEYHKASPATKRTIVPYIMGQLTVPMENDVLAVKPVALVIMNALPGKTLSEQSGFGPAELRRMIPCLTDPEDIPEDARFSGDAIVAEAKKAGPAKLPKPTGARFRPEDVVPVLQPSLAADARGAVDFETFAMLAEAMSGATNDPVPFVVRDLLTCLETVALADSTWRVHVSGGRAAAAATSPPPTPKPLTVREQTLAVLQGVGHVLDGGLDAYVHVQKLDALLRERNLKPEVTLARVKATLSWEKIGYPWPVFKALYPEWKKTGDAARFSQAVRGIVERFGTFEAWEKALAEQKAFLAKYGGSWDDVKEVAHFREEMKASGLSIVDGRTLVRRLAEEGERQGKKPAEAVRSVFDAVKAHDDLHAAIEQHKDVLARARAEISRVEARSRQDRIEWGNEQQLREKKQGEWAAERAKWAEEKAPHEALVKERQARLAELAAEEEAAKRSYGNRVKALDEREASLRAREEAVVGREEAIEVGEVAKSLLWEAAGRYGDRAARRFEDLAQCARTWKAPNLKYADLRLEIVRNQLMFLARPWIQKEYVTKAAHERLVKEFEGVEAKLAELTANAEQERRRHGEEKRVLEQERGEARGSLATYETWLADPGKLTPAQAEFVKKHYGEIFGDRVGHSVYVMSRASQPYLVCLACHDYYAASLPGVQELYAAGDAMVYPYVHRHCGRVNEYEPRVLLALQGLAMPKAIWEASDGR